MRIRCAICNKSVDKVVTWVEPAQRHWLIEAKCHGAVETMKLSFADVAKMAPGEFETYIRNGEGVAFATKAIEAPGR